MPTWKAYAKKDDITATKLDDFAAPDDNTDLNATNARHGLLLKLIDDTAKFLRSDGSWAAPAAGGLTSKLISSSKNLADASGDTAYTGVGFTPTVIIALAWKTSTIFSIGFADSAKAGGTISHGSLTVSTGSTNLIDCYSASNTAGQTAIVKSYDADGFTLTWTKVGSPTGNVTLYFLCLK